MEPNNFAGYRKLLETLFGEIWGIYEFIVEEGKKIPISQVIEEALDSLPLTKGQHDSEPRRRGKDVLEQRFFQGRTLEKVATNLGVTREAVRQISNKSLRRLMHPPRSRRLVLLLIPSPRQLAALHEELRELREAKKQTGG